MATQAEIIDALIGEAIGEGDDGMAAVAWTMRNRADAAGRAIGSVVNGNAYSGMNHPGAAAKRAQQDPAIRARALSILNDVTTGAYPDPTGGATHYWSPKGMGGAKPYWADEEASQVGEYRIGNHVYLPKHQPVPIPPGELPSVDTLTDTVPPRPTPVVPVMPSIDMSFMRNPAISTTAANAQVTQPPALPRPRPNRPPPSLVNDTFGSLPRPSLPAANSLALDPVRGIAVPDLNAGHYTGPGFNSNYTRTDSPDFASTGAAPFTMPRLAPPTAIASAPLQAQRMTQSAVDPALQAALANRQQRTLLPPIPPSTIGQPPATRTVASVPMPALPRPQVPQSYAGMDTNGPRAGAIPDRLASSPPGLPANYGSMSPMQVASLGVGLGNEANPQGQRVTIPPPMMTASSAPMPHLPPGFGEGGVDAAGQEIVPKLPVNNGTPLNLPQIPRPMSQAPVPMPRPNRVAMVPGTHLPIPGALGGLMTAMNNASGPYNNGADNLLYNIFRGGDFNTPGAATARAGGGLFARNDANTGWIRVGRDTSFSPNNTDQRSAAERMTDAISGRRQ